MLLEIKKLKNNKCNFLYKIIKLYYNCFKYINTIKYFIDDDNFSFFTDSQTNIIKEKEKRKKEKEKNERENEKNKNNKRLRMSNLTVGHLDKIIEGDQINKDIKIISINIAGRLNDKIDKIKSYLKNHNPDILCLQETHTYTEVLQNN